MDGNKMAKFLLLLIAVDLLLVSSTEGKPWWRRRRSRPRYCSSSTPRSVAWVNKWHGSFSFHCQANQAIRLWKSEHRNCKKDRIHYFKCDNVPGRYSRGTNCQWTSRYVNGYEDPVMFKCEHNGFITGVSSYYVGARDRRFQFRCCRKRRYITYNCKHTAYMNNWGATLSYRVPSGCVLTGAYSYYRKDKADRRWKFEICQLKKCRARG